MLSSTAKNLFWLGRYLQRAKSAARLLEATQRLVLQSGTEEVLAVARIFGTEREFRERYPEGRLVDLIDYIALDEQNFSSIVCSIEAARRNAREERNNITVDLWESLNGLWLELGARRRGPRAVLDRGALVEFVKKQSVMAFGAAQVTLLRDEAYDFLQAGAFLERADNTAAMLDVKFHHLRPDGEPHARELDYYAWAEVLDCIGAFRTYRRIYRTALDPMKVVELMLLRRDVPRSVHHALSVVDASLASLTAAYGARGEADRLAGELHARLRFARIDQVFTIGLAKFLADARRDIAFLSDEIGRQYLFD